MPISYSAYVDHHDDLLAMRYYVLQAKDLINKTASTSEITIPMATTVEKSGYTECGRHDVEVRRTHTTRALLENTVPTKALESTTAGENIQGIDCGRHDIIRKQWRVSLSELLNSCIAETDKPQSTVTEVAHVTNSTKSIVGPAPAVDKHEDVIVSVPANQGINITGRPDSKVKSSTTSRVSPAVSATNIASKSHPPEHRKSAVPKVSDVSHNDKSASARMKPARSTDKLAHAPAKPVALGSGDRTSGADHHGAVRTSHPTDRKSPATTSKASHQPPTHHETNKTAAANIKPARSTDRLAPKPKEKTTQHTTTTAKAVLAAKKPVKGEETSDAIHDSEVDVNPENFALDEWCARYLKFLNERKLRITDQFRRHDTDGSGTINRKEFVEGILKTNFHTNRAELSMVFDMFDKDRGGDIDYREFTDTLKGAKTLPTPAECVTRFSKIPASQSSKKVLTVSEQKRATENAAILTALRQSLAGCGCQPPLRVTSREPFRCEISGVNDVITTRLVHDKVMLKTGTAGGWMTTQDFLAAHDPCRKKCLKQTHSAGATATKGAEKKK